VDLGLVLFSVWDSEINPGIGRQRTDFVLEATSSLPVS
jgi:hypothetical protein